MIEQMFPSSVQITNGLDAEQYTVTLAAVQNTTTETTVATLAIPAGQWESGQRVDIELWHRRKLAITSLITTKIEITGITGDTYSGTFTGATTEYFLPMRYSLVRSGADIILRSMNYVGSEPVSGIGLGSGLHPATALVVQSGANFAANITVSFKVKFDVADTNNYVIPLYARAVKFSAGQVL